VHVDSDVPEVVLERARAGDSAAIEAVLRAVQDLVYSIALRTLYHPHDAQDCAQEALLAVARGLPAFRGDSQLSTWVTAITMREATRARHGAARRPIPAERLLVDEADPGPGPDHRLLEAELELACATGLLTLLSVPVRAAYVLADVLGLPDRTGAQVLSIAEATYRQRVSRARRTLRADLDIRLSCAPSADGQDGRVERAAAELVLLATTRAPVDLSTPDFVAKLRGVAPELLTGLPAGHGRPPGSGRG
jgi:RNA polymerase sigma factor (sigma-70 family)